MIDIKTLRDDPERVRAAMADRGAAVDLDAILAVDAERRAALHALEQLRAEQNRAGEEIARLKKAKEDASAVIARMTEIKAQSVDLEEAARAHDADLHAMLLNLPNLPDAAVPKGAGEAENRVEKTWGTPRAFDFDPKDHVALGEALGILDFERAAKIAGARFTLSVGAGARLERALINFMLDLHTGEHGYTEMLPPFLVNSDSMTGTGQLPKFAADLFKVADSDFWLIPTAEVPVTNVFRDEILGTDQLPAHFTAYTPCFRSEAGSHGKDTRGMIRVHQFSKVELVKFTTPETSWDELEALTRNAETVLERLGLPYRRVALCTGDLGFSAAKTYDLEVWLPSQGVYREISSCSNFTDFQARRANIRFKRDKKPEFVHTLNGSGLAVGRTLVAILENYQEADGTVMIPEALRPYLGGLAQIAPRG